MGKIPRERSLKEREKATEKRTREKAFLLSKPGVNRGTRKSVYPIVVINYEYDELVCEKMRRKCWGLMISSFAIRL